ncbi:cytochrome P450 [Microbacterium sp. NPDC019599]|uniref:cytochrome P450 n=1 Tax=Microbacterium sp. NPDC019599 TaxID=3154690 RepID=UPI0033C8CC54
MRLTRGPGADSLLDRLPPASRVPLLRDDLDPVAELGELRERSPISPLALPLGLRGWLVTGYREARAVLADADSFSSDFRNLVGRGGLRADQDPGGLGMLDPPDHTRLRHLVGPEFTVRRLARLTAFVEQITGERLDAMDAAAQGATASIDLVSTFAVPIPALTISALLGIAPEDRDEFMAHCGVRFDITGGVGESLGAVTASLDYLRGIVAAQRRSPGDGLLGRIIAEHGDEVTDAELAGLADGVLTGGFESTASTLALSAIVLSRDEAARRVIREGDAVAVDDLVDELLRHLSVVQVAFPRFARTQVELGGVTIEKGDVVVCSLSGANRDPLLGSGLDRLRLTKAEATHLAFGHGVHRCVGAELARLELRVALPALFRRFPDLEVATAEPAFRELSIVFGVDELPVTLRPTA